MLVSVSSCFSFNTLFDVFITCTCNSSVVFYQPWCVFMVAKLAMMVPVSGCSITRTYSTSASVHRHCFQCIEARLAMLVKVSRLLISLAQRCLSHQNRQERPGWANILTVRWDRTSSTRKFLTEERTNDRQDKYKTKCRHRSENIWPHVPIDGPPFEWSDWPCVSLNSFRDKANRWSDCNKTEKN